MALLGRQRERRGYESRHGRDARGQRANRCETEEREKVTWQNRDEYTRVNLSYRSQWDMDML